VTDSCEDRMKFGQEIREISLPAERLSASRVRISYRDLLMCREMGSGKRFVQAQLIFIGQSADLYVELFSWPESSVCLDRYDFSCRGISSLTAGRIVLVLS
jgi:hypothetical protein